MGPDASDPRAQPATVIAAAFVVLLRSLRRERE
jgi:hypothetical protein